MGIFAKIRVILVAVACIVAVLMASASDYEDHQLEAGHYCEMVAMFEQDARQGVEPERRRGWPNYKGLPCQN